jgi:DNA-binding protein WhiA
VALSITTENPAVARHIKTLVFDTFGISASLMIGETGLRGRHVYELKLPEGKAVERILKDTGILCMQDDRWQIAKGLPEQIFRTKCCRKACLKGLFLGAGSVSDPEKAYHLELAFTGVADAQAAKKLIGSFTDIHAKIRRRRGYCVAYIKNAEQIKDVLNITGAHTQLLRFENVRVLKELRDRTNRVSNCDSANLDRVLQAADRQLGAIRMLREKGLLEKLPPELAKLAGARIMNPYASLTELGDGMCPRLGKSTVNARLARIEAFAKDAE